MPSTAFDYYMVLPGVVAALSMGRLLTKPTHWTVLPPGYEGARPVALKMLRQHDLLRAASAYGDPPAARRALPPAVTVEEALGDPDEDGGWFVGAAWGRPWGVYDWEGGGRELRGGLAGGGGRVWCIVGWSGESRLMSDGVIEEGGGTWAPSCALTWQ